MRTLAQALSGTTQDSIYGSGPSRSYLRTRRHLELSAPRRQRAEVGVTALCRRYLVTTAGFYAWRRRGVSAHAKQDRTLSTETSGSLEMVASTTPACNRYDRVNAPTCETTCPVITASPYDCARSLIT